MPSIINPLRSDDLPAKMQLFQKPSPEKAEQFSFIAEQWYHVTYPTIKESSAVKYRNMLDHHLLPYFGEYLIWEIDFAQIELFSTKVLRRDYDRNGSLSQKTVSDLIALLRSILRYAARKGCSVSPDAFNMKIKSHPPRMRVLTVNEQERLSQYLRQHLFGANIGILLALFTGMRIGEVCALQWEDISLAEGFVSVHRTMQRIQTFSPEGPRTKVVITAPKSPCSVRLIPVPLELLHIFTDDSKAHHGFFLTGSSEQFIEPRTLQNHFQKAAQACDIPDVNFHTLRHTFATRCVELGFDVKTLSELLGHSSVSITMNRYVHPTMDMKRSSMQRFSKWLPL